MSITGVPTGDSDPVAKIAAVSIGFDKQTIRKQAQPDTRQIESTRARAILEKLMAKKTNLQISTHPETGDIIIRIQDASTGEIIREIPSQEVLDQMAYILKRAGLLIDKAA